jgi:hypothetical protein
MLPDSVSIWWVLPITMLMVLACLLAGRLVEARRQRSGKGKFEVSGVMVGASMGLLSFLLAFTFNAAANRHEVRKALVVEEAAAIEQAWRRAGLLPATATGPMRALLRDYVELRVSTMANPMDIEQRIRGAEALQERMWMLTEEAERQNGTRGSGLFIRSLDAVNDVHLRRMTMGLRNRVPETIWVILYALLGAGMVMMGIQIGQSEQRHGGLELALAVAFSLVLFLIADLDRPQDGLLKVSQQAMVDLQSRLRVK